MNYNVTYKYMWNKQYRLQVCAWTTIYNYRSVYKLQFNRKYVYKLQWLIMHDSPTWGKGTIDHIEE